MNRLAFVLYVSLWFTVGYWCHSELKQERAKVKYWNPKYIKDVVVFTGRRSRRDHYSTNITGTIIVPYGNNVSLGAVLRMKSGGDFRVISKLCDTMKLKWMREFTAKYSNVTLVTNGCPLPAGTYKYVNIELPPKNWPMPIMQGDYYVIMELFVTATKERILEISTLMHLN